MAGAPNIPATFHLKRNDLLPNYEVDAFELNGDPIDLSAGTAVFSMLARDGTLKINRQPASILVGDDGSTQNRLSFAWTGSDTDTPGTYRAEFEVTTAAKPRTFPTDPDQLLQVIVHDDLDSA